MWFNSLKVRNDILLPIFIILILFRNNVCRLTHVISFTTNPTELTSINMSTRKKFLLKDLYELFHILGYEIIIPLPSRAEKQYIHVLFKNLNINSKLIFDACNARYKTYIQLIRFLIGTFFHYAKIIASWNDYCYIWNKFAEVLLILSSLF